MGTAINYGKAITQTHVNNWESAQTSINQLLVDQPTRADLLYDAGVAAYRLQEYPKAQAYFEHVTQSDAPLHLKEQAYFNMGNAYVQQKQLKDAIVAYEQVLDINPDNERAQHNLEIVKQMLQEEEQQKQQEEQKQDQQQDKQKQQQQQNNSANNQQNQHKDDAQNNDDQKSQDQTDGSQQNTQDNKQDSNKDDGAENNADQNGEQNKQANDTGDQKQDGHEQEQQLEQNSQQGTTEQEQRANQHKKSPDEDQQEQRPYDMPDEQQNQTDTSEQSQSDIDQALGQQAPHETKKDNSAEKGQAQDLAEDEKSLDPKEKFIRLVLAQQEDADAQANKRMIKRAIDKNLAGQHGQKRW